MLTPFPPASLIRQLIMSRIIFTWECPKALSPPWVMQMRNHLGRQRHGMEWCERMVTPRRMWCLCSRNSSGGRCWFIGLQPHDAGCVPRAWSCFVIDFWLWCLRAQACSPWWCEGKLLIWSLSPCGNVNMKLSKPTWWRVREISLLTLTSLLQLHFHISLWTATVIVRVVFRRQPRWMPSLFQLSLECFPL